MKVWCSIGLADTWLKPQLETIGQWHMLKFKRFLSGQWPKKLPGYTLLSEDLDVAPSPYAIYDPNAGFYDDDTDFYEEVEEEDGSMVD